MRYYRDIHGNLFDSESEEVIVYEGDSLSDAIITILNHIDKVYVKKYLVKED